MRFGTMMSSAIAIPLFCVPPATAQTLSDSVAINGSVPPTCAIEAVGDIALGALTIAAGAGDNALQIVGDVRQESDDLLVSCNDTNVMQLVPANGWLINVDRPLRGNDAAGFTDRIDYRIEAIGQGGNTPIAPAFRSGDGSSGQDVPHGARHRAIRMVASILAADNAGRRPIAGRYQDSVTIMVMVQ